MPEALCFDPGSQRGDPSMRFTADQVTALQALVSGAGMTWAEMQTLGAANAPGMIVTCSDFPMLPAFRSDGTRWRPFNGRAPLYTTPATSSVATPAATLTGNASVQYFVLPTPALIPAGMLFAGAKLVLAALGRKNGTHTGVWRLGIAQDASGTGVNTVLAVASGVTDGTYVRGVTEAKIYTGGFMTTGPMPMSGPFSSGISAQVVDKTDASINTAARYVVIGVEASYTDSLASLLAYEIWLEG